MHVKISGKYLGDLRMEHTHGPSETVIETDPPVDNNGKGEKFSPTDLVTTALGGCMLTMMAMAGERDGLELQGSYYEAEKHMSSGTPRRIGKIVMKLYLPASLDDKSRKKLEATAKSCPVHHSLSPEIEQELSFNYVL